MPMFKDLADVGLASVPEEHLADLAELRAVAGVAVLTEGNRIWVRWEPGDERVLAALLPIPGAVLYGWRDGAWHRLGGRLPAFDVPSRTEFRPLHDVLFPARAEPLPPPRPEHPWKRLRFAFVRDGMVKPTTALLAPAAEVLGWVVKVPTAIFEGLYAAATDTHMLVLGVHLPMLPGADRFWGRRVLQPLGFCVRPALPERALLEAAETQAGDLLLLHQGGETEVIPAAALAPLTRAGVRQLVEGTST